MGRPYAARSLVIDDGLREMLFRYRVQLAVAGPPVLTVDAVQEVERMLGLELPDEVLALLAAAGRDPYQVLVLTEDAKEEHGLPRRLTAFGHDASAGSYWCVEVGGPPENASRVHQWSEVDLEVTATWPDLTRFLRDRFGLDGPLSDSERLQLQQELKGPGPELVASLDSSPPRRVFHPIFGVGVVLQEVEGKQAKLKVDFGPAGERVILASYLRDVEPFEERDGGRPAA